MGRSLLLFAREPIEKPPQIITDSITEIAITSRFFVIIRKRKFLFCFLNIKTPPFVLKSMKDGLYYIRLFFNDLRMDVGIHPYDIYFNFIVFDFVGDDAYIVPLGFTMIYGCMWASTPKSRKIIEKVNISVYSI